MVSLTLSLTEEMKNELKAFIWVNWSEIARIEAVKKLIFESYMLKKDLTDAEWAFCERIDWHPVDQLPLREDFIKKLEKIKKEKPIRFNSVADLFKGMN